MGRVLFGGVILAILGGWMGSLPSYRSVAIYQSPGPRLEVGEPLRAISTLIGVGAGAIVGALAGVVSAQPGTRPLPRWVWLSLLVVIVLVIVLGVLFCGSSEQAPQPAPQMREEPAKKAIDKGEK
jgi:hypothetical protein